MTSRQSVLVLLVFLLGFSGCSPEPTVPERPNILFIFADDHTRHAISAYGSVINETPNIDRIADEGLLFTHCLVTNSICAPSRATVLTGKYSHMNGQLTNFETFDGSQQTFPKLLREAGYQTAVIGKWHLKSSPTGFDYWRVLIDQGPYYNPPIGSPQDTVTMQGYTSEVITDLAIGWLDSLRSDDEPFMLMYQHKAPHRHWQPSPDRLGDYDDVDVPMPGTFYDDYSTRSRAAEESIMRVADNLTAFDLKIADQPRLQGEQAEAWNAVYGARNERVREAEMSPEELERWKYQRYTKDYLRTVSSLDDAIGRMLDYLDESGLAENTIVMYVSDQGWYLGEHGWYDKRWMYEPSLRTPFLVRWPGVIPQGSVSDAMVSNLDLGPTFLALAGLDAPSDMQGESLLPVFEAAAPGAAPRTPTPLELVEAAEYGAEVPMYATPPDPIATFETPSGWRGSFYYQYYEYPGWHCVRRHYGVRTDRYKLIYYYTLDEWELFDLETDPDELNNLADDPSYSEVRAELESELISLRERYQVPDDNRPDGEGECSLGGVGWPGYDS